MGEYSSHPVALELHILNDQSVDMLDARKKTYGAHEVNETPSSDSFSPYAYRLTRSQFLFLTL